MATSPRAASPPSRAIHKTGDGSVRATVTGAASGVDVAADAAGTDPATTRLSATVAAVVDGAGATPGMVASSGPSGVASRTAIGPAPGAGALRRKRPCIKPTMSSTSATGSAAPPAEIVCRPMPAE